MSEYGDKISLFEGFSTMHIWHVLTFKIQEVYQIEKKCVTLILNIELYH